VWEIKKRSNPERVRLEEQPFQGSTTIYVLIPGLSLRSNPGLKLANAFGVFSKSSK
jgi:hypothetical protein